MNGREVIIKIEHLSKSFQTDSGEVPALSDIDLEIERREIYGIIGLSGAGKSTLVRCINYLEIPSAGDVIFEGKRLGNMREKERLAARRSMGMIFQQFNLLKQRNALQNVCFPLELEKIPRKEAERRAEELLTLVGLKDRMRAYPAELSGGQKQRVAIARAIATNPKVLLCDEATSALDPNTTGQILTLLKDINRKFGITVIMITHQMSVIEAVCDRVAIIDKSCIAEEGSVQEIFSSPKTKIGRELILGKDVKRERFGTSRKVRITFDGLSSFEPVIANMILSCNVPVNILYAATRDIKGQAAGHMILQLPESARDVEKVFQYLRSRNVNFEEVTDDAF